MIEAIAIICIDILIAMILTAAAWGIVSVLEYFIPDRMARFWEWLGMEAEDE